MPRAPKAFIEILALTYSVPCTRNMFFSLSFSA